VCLVFMGVILYLMHMERTEGHSGNRNFTVKFTVHSGAT
jgi:hypothetical protein